MIHYINPDTKFKVSEKEVNEHICMLVIFCRMNPESIQAKKLQKHLKRAEKAIARGEFKH